MIKSNILIRFFIFFLPVFFLPIANMGALKSKYYAEILCFIVLSSIYIFNIIKNKENFKLNTGFHLYSGVFFVFLIVSAFLNSFNVITTYNLFFQTTLFIFLVFSFEQPHKDRKIPVNTVFYSGIIPVFSAFLWNNMSQNDVFSYSTFGNQNFLSSYIVLISSYYLKMKKNFFSNIVFALYFFTVMYSGSRNGLIGFIIIFAFLVLKEIKLKKIILFTICVFVLLSIVFLFKYNDITRISSIEYRLYLNRISANIISNNLISGIGSGNYGWKASETQGNLIYNNPQDVYLWKNRNNISHAHNEFLELFCEYGLISLIFVFIIWKIKDNFDISERHSRLFLILVIVLSLFSFPLRISPQRFIFLLFIISIYRPLPKNIINKPFGKKIILFCLIELFLVLYAFALPFYSEVSAGLADSSAKDNKEDLQYYFRIFKGNINACERLCFLYVLNNEYSKFNELERFASQNYFSSNITATKGFFYEKQKNYEKAEYLYKKAVYSSKRYFFPVKRLTAVFLMQGKKKEAMEFLDNIKKYDSTEELEEFYNSIKSHIQIGME